MLVLTEYFVKYLKKELNFEDEDKMANHILKRYMNVDKMY